MRRDLDRLTGRRHDVVVVGGGITGACIARDAARRGLSVALVEKRDFSSATSAGSSKLVHGGLRYLKNMELGLIRESLAERRIWQRIAPHMVTPLGFLLPVPGDKPLPRFVLGTGLGLYDLLAFDRNKGALTGEELPGHRFMAAPEIAERAPVLGDTGAFLYYDCQMLSPERLGLECLEDAARSGAAIANYVEAGDFLFAAGSGGTPVIEGIAAQDLVTGQDLEIRGTVTVNAGGPWADLLLARLFAKTGGKSGHRLLRSKGIHLITRPLTDDLALTVQPPKSMGGGHIFILPWRGHSIIGTTDTTFSEAPEALRVEDGEITEYLERINAALPGAGLERSDVIHAYAGLRPLIESDPNGDSYNASRKAEVVDHAKEGEAAGLLSAIGGKWTTSRRLAEKVVDRVAAMTGKQGTPCDTGTAPLPGAPKRPFTDYLETADMPVTGPGTGDPRTRAHLLRHYGARAGECLRDAGDAQPLGEHTPDIAGQLRFAVEEEMALTLEDALFRRTGLGTLGHPGPAAMRKAAAVMGGLLGWDEAEQTRQIKAAETLFFAGLRADQAPPNRPHTEQTGPIEEAQP